MNELVGIITKNNYLDDNLVKDVLCVIGGNNPLRLGESGCQFSLKEDFNISNLYKVRSMKVDVNIVSRINREKQLLIADMDSTLINEECIDELAGFTDFSEKVLEITKAAMNGKISFSESLIRRTELFKGINLDILEECFNNFINISDGAKTLVSTMNSRNARTYIVSGGYKFFVNKVANLLKVTDHFSNDVVVKNRVLSGKLKKPIIGEIRKLNLVKNICKKNNLSVKNVISVGDGANDIKMLATTGYGVAFKSKNIVKKYTKIHIDYSDLTSLLFLQGINEKQFVKS